MSSKSGCQRHYEQNYKQAAVQFMDKNGSGVEAAAAELGVDPADLRAWQKELGARKPVKALSGMAQLRAENEALRNQVVNLQMQWDILKTTLGVLSTTITTRETT